MRRVTTILASLLFILAANAQTTLVLLPDAYIWKQSREEIHNTKIEESDAKIIHSGLLEYTLVSAQIVYAPLKGEAELRSVASTERFALSINHYLQKMKYDDRLIIDRIRVTNGKDTLRLDPQIYQFVVDNPDKKKYRVMIVKESAGVHETVDTAFNTREEMEAWVKESHSELPELSDDMLDLNVVRKKGENEGQNTMVIKKMSVDQNESNEGEYRIVVKTLKSDGEVEVIKGEDAETFIESTPDGHKILIKKLVDSNNVSINNIEVRIEDNHITITDGDDVTELDAGENQYIFIHKEIVIEDMTDEEFEKIGLKPTENNLELAEMQLYPNPSAGDLQLDFTALPGEAKVVIRDMYGHEIVTQELYSETGEFSTRFDIRNEAAGIFFVTMRQEGKSLTKKIMVK